MSRKSLCGERRKRDRRLVRWCRYIGTSRKNEGDDVSRIETFVKSKVDIAARRGAMGA